MPAIQSTYNDRPRKWVVGAVQNMETANSVTRQCQEAGGIGFGLPVFKGTTDKGVIEGDSEVFSAVAAARAGNTGNGTITPTPTVGVGAKAGVYTAQAFATASNAGKFRVEDPDGIEVGVATVGVAFNRGGLQFTIADGATDFVDGDTFEITVTATAGGNEFEGMSIRDVTLVARAGQTVDLYQLGDSMGVLTAGVMPVLVGGAVVARRQAYFNASTKKFVAADGANVLPLPNCVYDTSGAADGDIVLLRVSAY